MLLPDHAPIGGGPDLSTTLWIGLPVGGGSFVQQHDLARQESDRACHRHRIRALDGVGRQIGGSGYVHGVGGGGEEGRADDDQRRGFGADGLLKRLGAIGLRQRRLARPRAAQRYPLVDQQVVAAVDEKGAGRELHDLAGRAGTDGGLDLGRVVACSTTGVEPGANRGPVRDAARSPHAGVPRRGPVGRQDGADIEAAGCRRLRSQLGKLGLVGWSCRHDRLGTLGLAADRCETVRFLDGQSRTPNNRDGQCDDERRAPGHC